MITFLRRHYDDNIFLSGDPIIISNYNSRGSYKQVLTKYENFKKVFEISDFEKINRKFLGNKHFLLLQFYQVT